LVAERRASSTSHPNTWHKSRYSSRSAIYRSSGSEPPAANSQLRGYDRLSGPTRSSSGERATASQITELLGLLPFLLEQAGAYIRETRLSLVGHLERLQRNLALTVAKGRPRARTDTVATTWQVSLERVRPTPGAVSTPEVGRRPRRPSPDPLPPLPPDLHQQVARPAADGGHYGWKTTVRRP
jgi:hypothetical protein